MSGLGVPLDPEDLPSCYRPRTKDASSAPANPERRLQRRHRRTTNEYNRRRAIQDGIDELRELLLSLEADAGRQAKMPRVAAMSRVDVMVETVQTVKGRMEEVSRLQRELLALEEENARLKRLRNLDVIP